MRIIRRTNQFKKDYKLAIKRGKEIKKLDSVLVRLAKSEKLEEKFRDHMLLGKYQNRRECHIEGDWLLIYKMERNEIIFERTGSHSDLFE